MKVFKIKNMVAMLSFLAAGAPLASCVDDSYDMGKDIDLTMGLGSEGLQLKLGATERIMLADILEVDENLQTDVNNQYYLVEKGHTNVDFSVNTVNTRIEKAVLQPTYQAVDFDLISSLLPGSVDRIPVPADMTIERADPVHAVTSFKFDVNNIQSDVTWIKSIKPVAGTSVKLYLHLENQGTNILFKDVKDLVITLPGFLRLRDADQGTVEGNQFHLNDRINANATSLYLGEAMIDDIYFSGTQGQVQDGKLHIAEDVEMEGNFSFRSGGAFDMSQDDYTSLRLEIFTGEMYEDYSEIRVDEVTGRFNPVIDPSIEDIDVATGLPDFLRDDEVEVTAANPTIRFDADMTDVPVSLDFRAGLAGVKDAGQIASVVLPKTGKAELAASAMNTIYFYQDAAAGPYDPTGVVAANRKYAVDNISDLITRIPDVIKVDMGNGRVSVKDEDHTIALGRNYAASVDYRIWVPFTFNAGLKIVYNDSITGMNKDLVDYQADGMLITATVENAIPMQLFVSGTAIDVNGNALPGIHISEATVAPATGNEVNGEYEALDTPITLVVTLDNPADLGRLDRINFNVKAGSDEQGGTLSSDQYILVKDIRLKLTGNIIADFN